MTLRSEATCMHLAQLNLFLHLPLLIALEVLDVVVDRLRVLDLYCIFAFVDRLRVLDLSLLLLSPLRFWNFN